MSIATRRIEPAARTLPVDRGVPSSAPSGPASALRSRGLLRVGSVVAILALAGFFRAFRLSSLFPILVDEAIYLRWAEIIEHQGQWFISLLDAKEPLSYWTLALIRMAAPGADPLVSGRLLSVAAGLGTTALLFLLGRRLGGYRAGLSCALFYAVLPYGVLYDRLAYTDALVNFFGVSVTIASLWCFDRPRSGWGRPVVVGAIFGFGIFTKTTVLLDGLTPLFVALAFGRETPFRRATALAELYTTAAVLPCASFFWIPEAPMFAVHNLLLHHTDFFTPPPILFSHPLINVLPNAVVFFAYLRSYTTLTFLVLSCLAIGRLAAVGARAAWLAIPLLVAPIGFQLFVMQFTQSRYVFPHAWPFALFVALALGTFPRLRSPKRATLAAAAAAAPLLAGSVCLIHSPGLQLQEDDREEFLGSGPYCGYGIREAVSYLRAEADKSPITILTDPIWGPPADAIFPYLNLWHGAHVYDAWWMQLSADRRILPVSPVEVMKSQYERIAAGTVDFASLANVFYLTDTNYNRPQAVARREPNARLVARFPKRNGVDSIDVYRLR